jgi:ribosomal protein S18 acetylase RimI-like enzyme
MLNPGLHLILLRYKLVFCSPHYVSPDSLGLFCPFHGKRSLEHMNSYVKIRPARPEDADQLVEFNLRMASETEGMQLDPEILTLGITELLQDASHGFYLVADFNGVVVGCLMITTEWSDWRNGEFWWIQSVYVSPQFRRQGVFRTLYGEARRRAEHTDRVCGCRLYVEKENLQAQTAYSCLGFTETNYKVFEDLF